MSRELLVIEKKKKWEGSTICAVCERKIEPGALYLNGIAVVGWAGGICMGCVFEISKTAKDKMCLECGTHDPQCQCWNDE